jgi:hypothetical protein
LGAKCAITDAPNKRAKPAEQCLIEAQKEEVSWFPNRKSQRGENEKMELLATFTGSFDR